MRSLLICTAVVVFLGNAIAIEVDIATGRDNGVKFDPEKSPTILGNPKAKGHNGRSLVAVNEQSQERTSSRFFGPPGYGAYPALGGPAQFPGGFGGYPGGYVGYGGNHGYFGGYPGSYPGGYPGSYPGGYHAGPGYPQAGAFAGQGGFGYGLQQQQQLQGGGFASGAFAG